MYNGPKINKITTKHLKINMIELFILFLSIPIITSEELCDHRCRMLLFI